MNSFQPGIIYFSRVIVRRSKQGLANSWLANSCWLDKYDPIVQISAGVIVGLPCCWCDGGRMLPRSGTESGSERANQCFLGIIVHSFPSLFMIDEPQGPYNIAPKTIETEVEFPSEILSYFRPTQERETRM
jgi:hypothetical protein